MFSPKQFTESGNAIVELAMIAGLLIIMGFTSSSLCLSESNLQLISLLSREAANSGFRDCIKSPTPDECLAGAIAATKRGLDPRTTNTEIILSLYTCSPGTYSCSGDCDPTHDAAVCTCSCAGGAVRTGFATTSAGVTTRYPNPALFSAELSAMIDRQESIVISEVFFQEAEFGKRSLYESTIY